MSSRSFTLLILALCACGEAVVGGTDDAGGTVTESDAGRLPESDAGTTPDAGSPATDAGLPIVDAGMPAPDAGSSSVDAGVALASITTLAGGSACYHYQWPGRGQMPRGYLKGVALSFARGVCNASRADIAVVSMPKGTNTQKDALAWYATEFAALNMNNSVAGLDTYRHTYTLVIGLGMRESSGEHCTGRVTSATNTTADSAEAGAWQTSYDSHVVNAQLPVLFAQYRAATRGCFLSTYAEGVTCTAANWQNWGMGDGAVFQQLEKECPGFAAEYAAVMLRVDGGSLGHYGPLRTKAAEIRPECDTLLQSVQAIVAAHPEVCSVL